MTTSCRICGAEIIEPSSTCTACGAPVDTLPLEVPSPPQKLGAKIMHPKRARPRRQRQYFAVARPLALAAAVLGLFSLLMPWVMSSSPPDGTLNTLGHYATDLNDYDGTLAIVAVLVLLGSLLTFVTSAGSFASLAGVIIFALDMKNRFQYVSVGFPIAVVASVLGMASLLFRKPLRIWDRFLVFAPSRERRGLRLDVISIGAAVVALIATVLPWLVTKGSYGSFGRVQNFPLFSFLDPNYLGSLNLSAASAVFIFGAIACLFTEIGATALVVGTVWSFLELRPMLISASGNGFGFTLFNVSTGLGPGFYVGILAAALGLFSLMFVYRMTLPDWLTVWSSGRSESIERVPGPSAEAIERPTRSSLALLVSNWKKLAATAIAIGAIVAAVGFTYLLPLSKIEVRVDNMNQESIAQVTIYLDGREIKSGSASSSAFLAAVVSTTAGVHTVSIDYGWLGQNQSAKDGIPDWYSDLIARPFEHNYMNVQIGFEGSMQPILQATNESIPSGQKISVESITRHAMGSTVIADLQWGDVSIILTDGNSSVRWQPSAVNLSTGHITRQDLPEASLGALTVLCNATDLMGNGYVNAGDFFTIISSGGNVFSSHETYKVYIMYEPGSSLLAEVDFQGP